MKTVFEEGDSIEQQPLPGEIIEAFRQDNRALIIGAIAAHRKPCVSTLNTFDRWIEQAPASVGPFFEWEFFRNADTAIPVQEALYTVTDATERLARLTKTIHLHGQLKQTTPKVSEKRLKHSYWAK